MYVQRLSDDYDATSRISTGHLPDPVEIPTPAQKFYERHRPLDQGKAAAAIPALAAVRCKLFGIAATGTNGQAVVGAAPAGAEAMR